MFISIPSLVGQDIGWRVVVERAYMNYSNEMIISIPSLVGQDGGGRVVVERAYMKLTK